MLRSFWRRAPCIRKHNRRRIDWRCALLIGYIRYIFICRRYIYWKPPPLKHCANTGSCSNTHTHTHLDTSRAQLNWIIVIIILKSQRCVSPACWSAHIPTRHYARRDKRHVPLRDDPLQMRVTIWARRIQYRALLIGVGSMLVIPIIAS